MLHAIISFSVRNKLIVGILLLGLISFGSYSVTQLPIDAVPDITNNQVQVITVAPSLAAPEVERLITFPVEQANANISGLVEIRSFSRFGLSVVTIVFEDEVDVYWARQQVSERLIQVQNDIPAGAGTPQLGPITTGLGEIYQYVLRPEKGYEEKYDAMELRTMQDWIVRRQLLGTPGVADVSSFGGFLKQYEVTVQADKLKSMGLTLSDVFAALEKSNQNTGGAYIEKSSGVLFIRSEGLAQSIADLEQIAVKSTMNGTPVLLRDVATIGIGHATRYGALTFNDQGEVAGAVVMMLKGANSSSVVKAVKEKIESIKKTLPEGVTIEPFLDRSKMVNNAIGTVEKNLLEGALIVVFILVLFLGNLRAGLVVASVIPLSMLFAIICMNMFGVSGNLMSLGALDFGLIVDGAVIIVEAVMHRLRHSKAFAGASRITQAEMNTEVSAAAGKMMNAAVFGQIIILIVYLPILSLKGIEGKMFKPMAQTVSFAIIGAFLLSVTYVPMMSSLVLSKKITHHDTWADKMMHWLEQRYKPVLARALEIPRWIMGISLALFAGSIFLLTRLGGEFIPQLEEGDFAVETRMLTGTSLTTGVEYVQQAARILKDSFPEVEKVVTKLGSGEIPTDPMPMDWGDMMVILKDKDEWTTAENFDALAEKMGEALKDVPGINVGFMFPVQMRFNELMTGARQDVVCKIFGENMDTLAHYAGKLGNLAGNIEGAKDLYVEKVAGLPQIVIDFNRAALARYGLQIEDVNTVINTAFAGASAGLLYEGERRFNLVVRLGAEQRKSLEDVQQLLIETPGGMQIPLNQVADVAIKEGPSQIQREDAKRRITVGFNVRGRDVQSIVEELQKKTTAGLSLPPGYYITYGGQFENLVEAQKRLSIAVPVALLLIFLLLYFAFRSVRQALLIFSAIPLSAIGGVFALGMRGMPFSISAGVGFIALFGVAVLNGIVLITEFNRLRREGMEDLREIVLKGTRIRLRPVLMTASVASLGFLPMALSNGAGAEVQRPLATVVIGGLITATLLTLLVLPILYVWSEQRKTRKTQAMKPLSIILLLCSSTGLFAQESTSLPEILQQANANNPFLRSGQSNISYRKQLERTGFNPDKANISGEYGNINSAFTDNRFGVSQTIHWPGVYSKQKALLKTETASAEAVFQVQEANIDLQVRNTYVEYLYWSEKKTLLEEAANLYKGAFEREKTRLEAGAAGAMGTYSAEQLLLLNTNAVQEALTEKNIRVEQLRFLAGNTKLVPETKTLLHFTGSLLPDSSISAVHPLLLPFTTQVKSAEQAAQLARMQQYPDFSIGYYNMSIRGWQQTDVNTEQYFDGNRRFSTVQAGILVPLLGRSRSKSAAAAQIKTLEAQQQLAAQTLQLRQAVNEETARYQRLYQQLSVYQQTILPNAANTILLATQQLDNGDISYLEWNLVVRQAMEAKMAWLDTQLQSAKSANNLLYLTGQNN